MKKLTPHHILTPKGGRVAARVKRHHFHTVARIATPALGAFVMPGSHNHKRTRTRGAGLVLEG